MPGLALKSQRKLEVGLWVTCTVGLIALRAQDSELNMPR